MASLRACYFRWSGRSTTALSSSSEAMEQGGEASKANGTYCGEGAPSARPLAFWKLQQGGGGTTMRLLTRVDALVGKMLAPTRRGEALVLLPFTCLEATSAVDKHARRSFEQIAAGVIDAGRLPAAQHA